MRHCIRLVVGAALIVSAKAVLSAQNATPPPLVKEIRVAAAANWSPYSGRDKNGQGIGPAYELIKKIVEPMGIKVVIANDQPWPRLVAGVKEGTIDVILTAYKVDPFGEYSEPYGVDEVKVFVKPGKEFKLNTVADLATKIGVQPQGAGYDRTFSTLAPGMEFRFRQNNDAKVCIEMVLNGLGDYYVSAYYDVLSKLNAAGYEGKLIDLENPVYTQDVVMVFSKASPAIKLLPEINAGIKKYRADGTVDKMIRSYMATR